MVSPEGWTEPGQRPEFEEITVVLKGVLHVEHEGGAIDVPVARRSSPIRVSGSAAITLRRENLAMVAQGK